MSQFVNLPSAENAVIRLHPEDNVAVARAPLTSGQTLRVDGTTISLRTAIPYGHKVALSDIGPGVEVVRYGMVIGRARQAIHAGEHVHVHNLTLEQGRGQYEFPTGEIPFVEPPASGPSFLGYPRPDGRAGTRNYIAIVPASTCAVYACELATRRFPRESLPPNVHGVATFPHGHGCSIQLGPDTDQLHRTISGVLDHPNVAFAVIIGLGCEVNQISNYFGDPRRASRLVGLTLQESGGTTATVEETARVVRRMIEEAAEFQRTEVPASKLVLGLQCGGSDALSGVTANPALGACCDRLIAAGGTAVLAETTETFGAENLLVRRARNRQAAEKYLALVQQYKDYLRPFGSSFDDNPSPGNKDGGLTNILEKSIGAVAKGGTTPLMDACDYAERIPSPGLVFMNTPGNDPISMTGLAAGGANIMAFTTGRGSASGFPIVPVIKISSNSATFQRMPENMDINAGRIADGSATVEEVGGEILDFLMRVASGEQTCAERLGHNEFVPWRIGPVL